MKYDVIIVGAGPIGLACGIEAQQRGLRYLILEKGCLVNSIYNYPTQMTFFSTSDKIEIGGVPFVAHGAKPNRTEALEYYRRVKQKFDLNVHTYEKVNQILPQVDQFIVSSERDTYHARSIVIATGFYDKPNLMNIPGEDLPKVTHYYREAHPYVDQEIVIVGARNSAVDVALESYRKGAKVTMVIREDEIHPKVKYWVRPDIVNRIKEGSIKAYFDSTLTEIRAKEVDIQTPEGPVTIPNDFVLAMTGYQPDFPFLASIGLEFSEDPMRYPIRDEQTFESNVPHVFLAGTVCGGMHTNKWFIENSIEHATHIMETLAGRL